MSLPVQCAKERDVESVESVRRCLHNMHVITRKNLPDSKVIYYSMAGRGDHKLLSYGLSYVITSTDEARDHSSGKSRIRWPCALRNLQGKQPVVSALERLLAGNVSEIALCTFRNMVNAYDVLLNESNEVCAGLKLSLTEPQCLTGGLPPSAMIAHELTNNLLGTEVPDTTAEYHATLLAAIMWTEGAGPLKPCAANSLRRLAAGEISTIMEYSTGNSDVRVGCDHPAQPSDIQLSPVRAANEILLTVVGRREAQCYCPALPSVSGKLVQVCMCTAESVMEVITSKTRAMDATRATGRDVKIGAPSAPGLRQSLLARVETSLADVGQAGRNESEARMAAQGQAREVTTAVDSPNMCGLMQRVDESVVAKCVSELRRLGVEGFQVSFAHSLDDGTTSHIAEACKQVALWVPTHHPLLLGTEISGKQKREAAEDVAATIMHLGGMRDMRVLGEDASTYREHDKAEELLIQLVRVAETWISNALYDVRRGEHYQVQREMMRWGKSHDATAAKWKERWRKVATALEAVQTVRSDAREEVSAVSVVEDDARMVVELCATMVLDTEALRVAVNSAMEAIAHEVVPDLNTTYGEILRVTNGISTDKCVSAVMPCAVFEMCTRLERGMRQDADDDSRAYAMPRYAPLTREQRHEREVLLADMYRARFHEAVKQAMVQQVEHRKLAIISAATRTLPPLPAEYRYAWSQERREWIGVPVKSGSMCGSITAEAAPEVSMLGETVRLVDIKNCILWLLAVAAITIVKETNHGLEHGLEPPTDIHLVAGPCR